MPLAPEMWASKVDLGWIKSTVLFSPFIDESLPNLVGVYESNCSSQTRFLIHDILFKSWDICDQSRSCPTSGRKFHVLGPPKFSGSDHKSVTSSLSNTWQNLLTTAKRPPRLPGKKIITRCRAIAGGSYGHWVLDLLVLLECQEENRPFSGQQHQAQLGLNPALVTSANNN